MPTEPSGTGNDALHDAADSAIVHARSALLAQMGAELTESAQVSTDLADMELMAVRLAGTPDPATDGQPPRILLQTNAVLGANLVVTPLDIPLDVQVRRTVRGRRKARPLNSTSVIAVVVAALLYIGFSFPTERYITPRRGLGYALGIIGGCLMLLLLVYSARKRISWLRFLGPTVGWFRTHMLLGVLGPLCILYHANFGLGAANSNVALFSMLAVSGSGLVGRYIYAHIHHGLYGRKLTLRELQQSAATLKNTSAAFTFLPELIGRLEAAEARILAVAPRLPLLGIAKLLVVSAVVALAKFRLHGYVRRTLRTATSVPVAQARDLRRSANRYVDGRLTAVRKVASFQAYERLFSLWHALHLPLIFILVAAAVVHVIAVNVY